VEAFGAAPVKKATLAKLKAALMDVLECVKAQKRIQRTARIHERRKHYHEYAGTTPQVALETPKRCSCYMCCNRRRKAKGADKLTMQEKRIKESHNGPE
jgi:hypothetical protein